MKKAIIVILCILASVGLGIGIGFATYKIKHKGNDTGNTNKPQKQKSNIYFLGSTSNNYLDDDYLLIESYDDYLKYYDEITKESKEKANKISKEEFNENKFYLIELRYNVCSEREVKLTKENVNDNVLYLEIKYNQECNYCDEYLNDYYIIRVSEVVENVKFRYNRTFHGDCFEAPKKPIIYIYPEKEMEVDITLGHPENLTTTYPKYDNGWHVVASPDGNLKYNNRNYYSLYWEGKNYQDEVREDGFIVKGSEVAKFLEEKLAILGLSEREANEFIIYWLPQLEVNEYNYIRFATSEEIEEYMPMTVTPQPDSIIRILMAYKPLDEPIKVKEQKIESPSRTGYTVVEWGGYLIR